MGYLQSLREKFIPITNQEKSQILYLCALKSLTSFIFSVLFSIKDAAIVTAAESGAEAIPVIKTALVLPTSIFAVLLYSKLSNYLTHIKITYLFISLFILYFIIHAFVLLPNESYFTPSTISDKLMEVLGPKNKHWIAVYRYWIHAFFFVVSEMWAQICLFILFWGFVNQVCSVDLAKRTYNLFIACGTIGGILQAPVIYFFNDNIPAIISILIFACLLLIYIYYRANKHISRNLHAIKDIKKTILKKNKLSLRESVKYIFKSKYLMAIAVTIIACGLTINLVQITWKANLKELFPVKEKFLSFMSFYDVLLNFISFFIVFFISGNALRKFGWKFCSLLPPVLIGVSGVIFFLISKYQNNFHWTRINPLVLTVAAGTFQAVLSKVLKYSFFDITKEIVYIPLDQESKTKGKAAVDTIGSRFGKSSSSFIHLLAFWFASTSQVFSITHILIPFLVFFVIIWVYAVGYLDKKMQISKPK